MLVLTTKRMYFNAFGTDKDWSRTWQHIANWGVFEDALLVELPNGRPVLFALDATEPITHPAWIAALMEYAAEGGRLKPVG